MELIYIRCLVCRKKKLHFVMNRNICKNCAFEIFGDRDKEIPSWMPTYLKTHYKLTLEQYGEILKEQGGTCAICDKENSGGRRFLYVDHSAYTGKVRGLLCASCNVKVGKREMWDAGISENKVLEEYVQSRS